MAQQISGRSFFQTFEKSLAKVNEQLNRKLAPEEVKTLIKNEIDVEASRNRLRHHQKKFENLSNPNPRVTKLKKDGTSTSGTTGDSRETRLYS